jgi:hypothetical protein
VNLAGWFEEGMILLSNNACKSAKQHHRFECRLRVINALSTQLIFQLAVFLESNTASRVSLKPLTERRNLRNILYHKIKPFAG